MSLDVDIAPKDHNATLGGDRTVDGTGYVPGTWLQPSVYLMGSNAYLISSRTKGKLSRVNVEAG